MARLITASAFKRPLELILEEKKLLDQQAVASLRKQAAELGISFEDVLIASSSLPDEVIFPAIAASRSGNSLRATGSRAASNSMP